jgi:hypothetical protein
MREITSVKLPFYSLHAVLHNHKSPVYRISYGDATPLDHTMKTQVFSKLEWLRYEYTALFRITTQ